MDKALEEYQQGVCGHGKDRFRVTEVFKRGEKVFKGKPHRVGWQIYKNGLFYDYLPEEK